MNFFDVVKIQVEYVLERIRRLNLEIVEYDPVWGLIVCPQVDDPLITRLASATTFHGDSKCWIIDPVKPLDYALGLYLPAITPVKPSPGTLTSIDSMLHIVKATLSPRLEHIYVKLNSILTIYKLYINTIK